MLALPITSLFAAGFALALVALSVPVTLRRVKVGTLMGPGADETLQRRIRAQANFAEYVPLALVLLALIELRGAEAWVVMGIGGALAVGRLLHAVGMWRDSALLRGLGINLTWLPLILAAFALLVG